MHLARTPQSLVLVVDDDESIRRSLGRLMRSGGLATETFASGEELLDALPSLDPGCAVVDVHLPGMDGLAVQRALHERRPDLPVFLITGFEDDEIRERALAAGAAGYLAKPFSRTDLLDAVLQAVEGE